MSTMALADLSREARRRFGLESDCDHPCPESTAVLSRTLTATATATAMIPNATSPRCRSDHGRIPLWFDTGRALAVGPTATTPVFRTETCFPMNAENTAETRLLAVCLGGRAPGCRVELHDVAFAVGTDLESIHGQLLDSWFGTADGLHVDAWAVIDRVPGFRVQLARTPPENGLRLYFVNIGGYLPGEFGERHAWAFYAGAGPAEVKARARRELLVGKDSVHRDDLHAVDDLIEVDPGNGWSVHLTPDSEACAPTVSNGYFPLPAKTIAAWKRARAEA